MYARQAITTRFCGPTGTRPSRVIARCDAGSLTWEWDDSRGVVENHAAAARELARRLGWYGAPGALPGHIGATRTGYVVVFIDDHERGTSIVPEAGSP